MKDKINELYNSSLFIDDICEILNLPFPDILILLENHVEDFQYLGAITFTQSHLKQILIDYVGGESTKVIAKKYGHCSKTVLNILKENKIALRPRGIQKIFPEMEPIIIGMYLKDVPTKEIAKKFNVRSGAIINVLSKHDIEIKKYIPTVESRHSSRKFHCNTHYFSKIDTEDKAYFLGLFASDGSFQKKSNVLTGVIIGLKESSSKVLEAFLKHLESTDSLRTVAFKYTYKGKTSILYSKNAAIYSKELAEDVRNQLELPLLFNKTFDLKFPTTIPLELQRHFCRGIFCGDGTLDTGSNKLVFYGTQKLLTGIRDVICRECEVSVMRIKPKITKTSTGENKLFELSWSGKRQILSILDWMYYDTDLYIDEKYEKYLSIDRNKGIIDITEFISIEALICKRNELNMSQLALARALSCSGAVISDLERNIRTTMTNTLAKKLLNFHSIEYESHVFHY